MSRHELSLVEKINLIKEKEVGLSYGELSQKFKVSVGAVSNILKRKSQYIDDYESNRNKRVKRKSKNLLSEDINCQVYEWFTLQRSKNMPISGLILQQYAHSPSFVLYME